MEDGLGSLRRWNVPGVVGASMVIASDLQITCHNEILCGESAADILVWDV